MPGLEEPSSFFLIQPSAVTDQKIYLESTGQKHHIHIVV